VAGTAGSHLRGVGVKYARIVGFSVLCEKLYDFRVYLIAVVLAGLYCHADTAVRLQRPLKGFVCLEAHNGFFIFIQVSGAMRRNGGNDLGIHIQYAAGLTLFGRELHYLIPESLCIFCRPFKEGVIAVVGGVVFLDEVADIDFMLPYTWCKCVPFCSHGRFLL